MDNYPANSRKAKEEQKDTERKMEKVVSNPAKIKKKSGMSKFARVFLPEDVSEVKGYIVADILIPAAKKAIMGTVDVFLNGRNGSSYSSNGRISTASKVSYRKYYDERRDDRPSSREPRTRFDYDDIGFETRREAEEVRDRMMESIERYKYVSVADMYDMADLTAPFTSNKYGWTRVSDIARANVVEVDGDYVIKLPRVEPLD